MVQRYTDIVTIFVFPSVYLRLTLPNPTADDLHNVLTKEQRFTHRFSHMSSGDEEGMTQSSLSSSTAAAAPSGRARATAGAIFAATRPAASA